MSADLELKPPVLWLITAREYLDAVHTLAILDAENDIQIRQTAPVLTLLAYAFELLMKNSAQLSGKEILRTHDLTALLGCMDQQIVEMIGDWSHNYIRNNQSSVSSDYLGAILNIDPDFGQPDGDFQHNLTRLNRWTNRPFQSRYPEVGYMNDAVVDIRFMYEIGLNIHDYLKPIANMALGK